MSEYFDDDQMPESEADSIIEEVTSEADEQEADQQQEDEDLQVLKDASLRLEQGNLYKMLLKHDLFADVEADARAVQNVQREIRNFIRERLEILVGLKTDPKLERQKPQTLGFSPEEVLLLKGMLSKVLTKGESKLSPVTESAPQKLNTLSSKDKPKTLNKVTTQRQQTAQPAPKEGNRPRLAKPLKDMTPEEIIEHNRKVSEAQANRKAVPVKKLPMPDAAQLTTMYSGRINTDPGQGLVGLIMNKMGVNVGAIETVEGAYDDSNDSRM